MTSLSASDIRTIRTGLTVRDLIEELSMLDPEAHVLFACDYGDHCHTQQALPVSTVDELEPDEERITPTAYSHSGLAVEPVECDEDGDAPADAYEGPAVVILR